jgi:deoxyribonuclease V
MRVRRLHDWALTPPEARRLQERLRTRLSIEGGPGPLRSAAGADVSYERGGDEVFAAVVVLDTRTWEPIEVVRTRAPARFPYVPGLLSFREAPSLLGAAALLRHRPDVLLCDGQGLAHPRRFGLACHVGLLLDLPTIGCAKTRLVGSHREPGPRRGQRARLVHRGETVGTVLRTRTGVKPVFVSPGHRIGLEEARRITLSLCRSRRLPEPVRAAHAECNRARRGEVPVVQEAAPC